MNSPKLLDANGTALYPNDRVASYNTDGELQTGTLKFDYHEGWYVELDNSVNISVYDMNGIYKLMEREVKI